MEGKGDSSYSTSAQGSGKTKRRIEVDENIDSQAEERDEIRPLFNFVGEGRSFPHGQDPGTGNVPVHGPATLKHGLIKGMEQLKEHRASCSNESQGRVLEKMLASYEEAISILDETISKEEGHGMISLEPDSPDSSADSSTSVDMIQTKHLSASSKKDRRGCYKRRRISESWTVVVAGSPHSGALDDGYTWRKYGQKVTLNSKHPRSYFRCANRFERGCRATKQVQRVSEDPEKYQVVYIQRHTCNSGALMAKPPPKEAESNSIVYQPPSL